MKGLECRSAGKHPVDSEWEKTPVLSGPDIEETWARKPWASNVGLATGRPSGFWVLDIDPEHGGDMSAGRLVADHGPVPATFTVKTGSGGYHYYFSMPEGVEITNSAKGLKEAGYVGIDVRGTGGQVVAAPSVSDKGDYRVVRDVAVAPAPDWLIELLQREPAAPAVTVSDVPQQSDLPPAEVERLNRYAERAVEANIARLRKMQGEPLGAGEPWNATSFEVACSLLEIQNSPWNGYRSALKDFFENAPTDNDGFDTAQLRVIWKSALERVGDKARKMPDAPARQDDIFDSPDVRGNPSPSKPAAGSAPARREVPKRSWDDLGNASRLVDYFGGTLRWVEEIGQWAVYTDGRWVLNGEAIVRGQVQRMFEHLIPQHETGQYSDVEVFDPNARVALTTREAFTKWLAGQRMSARISACLTEARGRSHFLTPRDAFDSQHHLLNVANGVVDLRSGQLGPHDASLLLMQQSPVPYDPTAAAPGWERFLERVMPDPAMRAYLQRIIGYSLTGDTIEQALFLHHGRGANGKSVMLQCVSAILGDYGHVVDRNALLTKANGQPEHPTAVAAMAGKRFLQVEETAAGRRLDEGVIKGITGGEKITARFMGKDFFEYTPVGKIQYVTNHLPRLSDADSIWRRMHLVFWGVQIPAEEQDKRLAQRLIETEAAGILAWAVRGAQQWYESGLMVPVQAQTDVAAYRADQDQFGVFLSERTELEPEGRVSNKELYSAYKAWAFENGINRPMTGHAFNAVMRERDFKPYRTGAGRGFQGLRMKTIDHATTDWSGF